MPPVLFRYRPCGRFAIVVGHLWCSPHYARDAVARSWRWSCHRGTIPRYRGTGPEAYWLVRRKVRDPRTPGRRAISTVAAGGSCIMRAKSLLRPDHVRSVPVFPYFLSNIHTIDKGSALGYGDRDVILARIMHETPSRDRGDGRATGQPQGLGPEAYLFSTSQGPRPEDAWKCGRIRGRSRWFVHSAG